MYKSNNSLLNFENSFKSSSVINSHDKVTCKKEKCGEIFINEEKIYLVCLFCEQNNQSLEEFQGHIFSEHLSEFNCIFNNENINNEFLDENIKNKKSTHSQKGSVQKKSEAKLVPILARRKSPTLFQTNWKKFYQKRLEFNNKLYEEVKQEEKPIDLQNDLNYEAVFKKSEDNMTSMFITIPKQEKACATNENSTYYEEFENDLLKNLQISESTAKETNKTYKEDCNLNDEFNTSSSNFCNNSQCESSLFDTSIKLNLLMQDESTLTNNENNKICSLICENKDIVNFLESKDKNEISSYNTKHDDGFFYCPLCPKYYRRFETLKNHYRYHTGEKNPYDCPVCQKTFSAKCRLEAHFRIHSNERPFPCHKCSRAFRQKQKLKHHLQSHEKGTIRDVSNPYHNPASLPILINNQSIGAENTKTINGLYQCPLCYKNYKRFDSLKEHAEIHVEGLEHNCPYCQKVLKTFRSLKKHITLLHRRENFDLISDCSNNKGDVTIVQESNDSTLFENTVMIFNDKTTAEVYIDHMEDENIIVEEFYCIKCKIVFKEYDAYVTHCRDHRLKYTS